MIAHRELPELRHTAISESPRYFTTTLSAPPTVARISRQPASDFSLDLESANASVGVAYVDLIELVIECSPIVHFAVKTA